MFCRFCGKDIPDGLEFCPSCGQAARLSRLPHAAQHMTPGSAESLREAEALAGAAQAAARAAEQCANAAQAVAQVAAPAGATPADPTTVQAAAPTTVQAAAPTTVLPHEDPTTNMDDAFTAPEDLFVDPISFETATELRPVPQEVLDGQVSSKPARTKAPEMSPHPRKFRWWILALLALLVAGAAGGYAWWQHRVQEQETWNLAHTERAIDLWVEAPGWTQDATGVPIRISGTDVDGTAVDDVRYVDGDGIGISLMPGNYTLSVAGSPFLADGTLLVAPRTVLTVEVAPAESAEANQPVAVDGELVFGTLDMENVTDEQIAAALDAASYDGANSARAEQLAQSARTMRENMQQARREAEEAARRQEEQEAEAERLSEREQLAAEFASAFYTTCAGDPDTEDFGPLEKDDYETSIYHYLATGTALDQDMLEYLYGEGASFGDVLTRCEAAEVQGTEGDEVRVRVTATVYTQSFLGFRLSTTESFDVGVGFDEDNKVTSFRLVF